MVGLVGREWEVDKSGVDELEGVVLGASSAARDHVEDKSQIVYEHDVQVDPGPVPVEGGEVGPLPPLPPPGPSSPSKNWRLIILWAIFLCFRVMIERRVVK